MAAYPGYSQQRRPGFSRFPCLRDPDLDSILTLGGAALDVLPAEPPTPDRPPPQAPRLVVNPHAAWYSVEAEEAVYTRPVLAVRAVLEGREPDGAVNRP